MKKETRIAVWRKYNKKCAYCGNNLSYENMQVDHFLPKIMMSNERKEQQKKELEIENIHEFKNLMPACRKCNNYKGPLEIEQFRKRMNTLHERLRKQSLNKIAENYAIINIKPFNGLFYFEK